MSFSTLEVVRRLELPYGLEVMLIWGELVAPGGIRGDGISGGKRLWHQGNNRGCWHQWAGGGGTREAAVDGTGGVKW